MKSTKKRKKIVFVNGIFDILHPGHIQLLRFAKSLGDKLIVGLNSDKSTKMLKGKERPINNQEDRKLTLESLGFVDKVVIFNEKRTGKIVRKVKPDILVRGDEHTVEEIRRTDNIPPGIEIKLFSMLDGFSTSNIIKNIKKKKNKK